MDVCDSENVAASGHRERRRARDRRASLRAGRRSVRLDRENGAEAEGRSRPRRITSWSRDILDVKQRLKRGNRLESLHDIQQIKEEAQQMFELGLLDLESKAKIDTVYWQIAQQIVNMHRGLRYVPEEVKELETSLGDQYLCNFSVFQSLLDHWALGQLFPIMPIHRLTTPPDRQGTIVDITCDSDGKVYKFIDLQDVRDTLPLHRINARRNLLSRLFPDRRVSGHHGRPAQSVWPRERGARLSRSG